MKSVAGLARVQEPRQFARSLATPATVAGGMLQLSAWEVFKFFFGFRRNLRINTHSLLQTHKLVGGYNGGYERQTEEFPKPRMSGKV